MEGSTIATAAEVQLVYLFAAMLVAGAVLLAFLPILHRAWTFAASRRIFAALIVVILALGIAAVLLVNSAISDPVYFVPIAAVTVALRLSSPFLLYRRVQGRGGAARWGGLLRWAVVGGFVGLVRVLVYHLLLLTPRPGRTGFEFDLDAELLCEFLVAVPDRDFGHAGDVGDLSLRAALVAQDRRDVDRGRGDAGGPTARGEFLVLGLFQDLDRARLDLAREFEFGTEPGHVVLRLRRHQLEFELAGHEAVRPADLFAAHTGRIRDLVEGPRDVALAARRVQ